MASKKKVAEPETVEEVAAEVAEPETSGSVTVTWQGRSRVYSKALHGADYKALAAEFAEKKKGKVA